jgi:hypothetical protein
MGAPYNIIGSKNDRAICAYLYSVPGLGINRTNCQPANSRQIMLYPYLTVITTDGTAEPNAPRISNWWVNVVLSFYFSATGIPAEKNPETQRVAMDAWIAPVIDALMLSQSQPAGADLKYTAAQITKAANALPNVGENNIGANNADMGDYTMQDWIPAGFQRGKPEEEPTVWLEKFHFRALVCPSSVS